jgi:hypothetical protein
MATQQKRFKARLYIDLEIECDELEDADELAFLWAGEDKFKTGLGKVKWLDSTENPIMSIREIKDGS